MTFALQGTKDISWLELSSSKEEKGWNMEVIAFEK